MLETVKKIVADSLGADIDTLTPETSFKEDLGADLKWLWRLKRNLAKRYLQKT